MILKMLLAVPRDNAHKDNGSNEDTEPRHAICTLLWVVACSNLY
jgi:hypothetical protein